MGLSIYDIKQILKPKRDSGYSDDFRILDSWAIFKGKNDVNSRKLDYLCYELETMDPETGETHHFYKALKFMRVIRLPKDAKQSTSFMEKHSQVLTAVWQQKINLVTIIANIKEPVPIGLLYLYGVQGVAKDLESAKKQAHAAYQGFLAAMQGTYRVLEMRCLNAQETIWLRQKMYHMDYMTVVRGIPKANEGGEDAGNKGMGGKNLNPDSQGTLENIIAGMTDYEYVIQILSTPVTHSTLQDWSRKLERDMTDWNSQLQGTKAFSFNLSLPMMFGSNQSSSQGWNKAYTDANSVNYSHGESFNTSIGENVGHALSQSFGHSFGQSTGQTITDTVSQSHGISQGQTVGETVSHSTGVTHTSSVSEGVNMSHSTGISQNASYGTSLGSSLNHNISSGLSENHGTSFGTSQNHGTSFGTSENQGLALGTSQNHNYSVGNSTSHSDSTSFGHTFGESTGNSHNMTLGENTGISQNYGTSYNVGTNESVNSSNSASLGHTTGLTEGHTLGRTSGLTSGESFSSSLNHGTSASGSHSSGISAGSSFGGGTNHSDNASNSFTENHSTNSSISHGTSSSTNHSSSSSHGWSSSHSSGQSDSQSHSHNHSGIFEGEHGYNLFGLDLGTRSHSDGSTQGTSSSDTNGTSGSWSTSDGYSQGVSDSVSNGHSDGWSRGTSLGTSDGYSSNWSENNGWNSSDSIGWGTSDSAGFSSGRTSSISDSTSLSNSASLSNSTSMTESESHGSSFGTSEGYGTNESFGTSSGNSMSEGWGVNSSVSNSQNIGYGSNNGYGTSISLSDGYGSSNTISTGHGTSSSQSDSIGTSMSQSDGYGSSSSISDGYGSSMGSSQSMGSGTSSSDSYGTSYSVSNSTGYSESVSRAQSVSNSVTESISESKGQSVGQSYSESTSDSTSTGTTESTGTSKSMGQGNSYSEGTGKSQSLSAGSSGAYMSGVSSSMGLNGGIGYSKSYQWLDQQVKDILELLEYKNERVKKSLRGNGMMYTYVYIACPSQDALSAAMTVAKTTWQNEFAMTEPLQVLELSDEEQKHLLNHFAAFSTDVTRENVYGNYEYRYATALLPGEFTAYTHLPRISEGGIFTEVNDVPKFSVPSMKKGEIFMGKILSAERFSAEDGYETPFDYRLDESELMHGFFTGASRSGKTVAAMRFIAELSKVKRKKTGKRMRIVCMDPKQDWRTLARYVEPERFNFYSLGKADFHPIKLNPLKIPRGVEPQFWIDGLIDIYCRAYGLLERGKQMMGETIYALYEEAGVFKARKELADANWQEKVTELSSSVTFREVYRRMEKIKLSLEDANSKKGRAGNDTRDAYARLLDRLQTFNRDFTIEYKLFGTEEGMSVDELIGEDDVTILESKGLEKTFRNFIFGIITSGFYKYAIAHEGGYLSKDQYETVLVIEEANEVLTGNDAAGSGGGAAAGMTLSGQSEFEEILDQSAGYGLFIIAITQRISLMPASIVANAGLVFAGKLKVPEDVTTVVRAIAREDKFEDRDLVKWFPRSPIGWFVCQSSRCFDFKDMEPILVHISQLETPTVNNQYLSEILLQKELLKEKEEKSQAEMAM